MTTVTYKTSGHLLTLEVNLDTQIIYCKAKVSCFTMNPGDFRDTEKKKLSHTLIVTLIELPVNTEHDLLLLLSAATIYRSLGLKEFINLFDFTPKVKKEMLKSNGTFASISSELMHRFADIKKLNPDMYAEQDRGILKNSFIDKKVLELIDSGFNIKILGV